MFEKLRAEGEHNASPDFRGEVGLAHSEGAIKDGKNAHQHCKVDYETGIPLQYSLVNDGTIDEGIRDTDGSVEHDDKEKDREQPDVGRGKAQRTLHGAWSYGFVYNRSVLPKGAQRSANSSPGQVIPPFPCGLQIAPTTPSANARLRPPARRTNPAPFFAPAADLQSPPQ